MIVHEVIHNCVDAIRPTGTYTSYSRHGKFLTIHSQNNLKSFEWVEIAGNEYKVLSSALLSFQIESIQDIPASGTWKALAPYFMFGHRVEIANRLLEKDKDSVYKYQKYPLIALRLPITETVKNNDLVEVSLNIAILEFTNKNYRAFDRYENVLKPILRPLYKSFTESLMKNSGTYTLGIPEHDKIDRLFYGVDGLEGNQSYIFNDPLDGIELLNLKLVLQNLNC